jgi:ribosome-binding protein aMBF1 (putative translation factor)
MSCVDGVCSGYQHQDWKPVILKKKTPVPQQKQQNQQQKPGGDSNINKSRQATMSAASAKPAWKIEEQVDSLERKPLDMVSKDIAKRIIQARTDAKLSQKELAIKANMTEREIRDIESAKAVENKAVLSKLKKILGIS